MVIAKILGAEFILPMIEEFADRQGPLVPDKTGLASGNGNSTDGASNDGATGDGAYGDGALFAGGPSGKSSSVRDSAVLKVSAKRKKRRH
jgi:hypothetical protein